MYNILLVDDEMFVLNALSALLKEFTGKIGKIRMAQDGQRALQLMREEEADIVFTDIRMPYMGGMELIEHLVAESPKCKIIILSGYDNFTYAQKAIANNIYAYLLKPVRKKELYETLERFFEQDKTTAKRNQYIKQLERQLQNNLSTLKEQFFFDLSIGRYRKELADFLRLKFKKQHYKILVCTSKEFLPNSVDFPSEKTKQLALLEISNTAENFFKDKLDFEIFHLQHRVCLLISPKSTQNNIFLEGLLRSLQDEMLANSSIEISVGISSGFEQILDFSMHLEQALAALKQKIYFGNSAIVFYENIAQNPKQQIYLNIAQQKQQIYQALEAGHKETVEKLLIFCKNTLKAHQSYSLDFLKNIGLDILSIFTIFSFEHNIDTTNFLHKNKPPYESILLSQTLDEIFEPLLKTSYILLDILQKRNQLQMSSTVCKIKQYIKENLAEDLSLDQLSEVVFLTPNYISTLFKKETGVSFSAFVGMQKMEYAKKLLCQTKLKIYEVAEAVGYRDVQYFSRIFKKTFGKQPTDYRQVQLQAQESDAKN